MFLRRLILEKPQWGRIEILHTWWKGTIKCVTWYPEDWAPVTLKYTDFSEFFLFTNPVAAYTWALREAQNVA